MWLRVLFCRHDMARCTVVDTHRSFCEVVRTSCDTPEPAIVEVTRKQRVRPSLSADLEPTLNQHAVDVVVVHRSLLADEVDDRIRIRERPWHLRQGWRLCIFTRRWGWLLNVRAIEQSLKLRHSMSRRSMLPLPVGDPVIEIGNLGAGLIELLAR